MPSVSISHIVSVSSEDPKFEANNLLDTEKNLKWKSKNPGEASISVIFQLCCPYKICTIDVGNEFSAFVEIFVGRSSCINDNFEVLLAMSSLMTPSESRCLKEGNRVRFFRYCDLNSETREEKWDLIKIVCSQPFNKKIQYGLSFIIFTAKEDSNQEEKNQEEKNINEKNLEKEDNKEQCTSLGKFSLRPESPNIVRKGSLFAKRKEKNSPINTNLSQEIKNSTTTPKGKNLIKISQPSSTTIEKPNSPAKNRNRKELFYKSDEEAENEKIDKVVKKVKLDEKKNESKKDESIKDERKKDESIKNERKKDESKNKKTSKQNNSTNSPSTSNANNSKRKLNKKKNVQKKPFNELFSGVVFTISGIVNPERTSLRKMALDLGAKYKQNWDKTCTHLICAFANTPKFQQVRGKGKIVTKKWIQDSYTQRKRLPWRRYALDRNDQGQPESENEINELLSDSQSEDETPSKKFKNDLSGSDTEGEIEKIQTKNKATNTDKKKKEEREFEADTDEEHLEKKMVKYPIEDVPQIFTTEIFYIDNVFSDNEKLKLERLIKAFNGVVLKRLSNILDFVITNSESSIQMKCSTNAKCVKPDWIYECHDKLQLVPFEKFLL